MLRIVLTSYPKQHFCSSFLLVQRSSSPLFDEEELQSEAVQRAWQYLQLYNEEPGLIQVFKFDASNKRDDRPEDCLETLIRFVSYILFVLYSGCLVSRY